MKTEEMIKGRWYKSSEKFTNNYYKYDHSETHSPIPLKWFYSEKIEWDGNLYLHTFIKDYICNNEMVEDLREVPIEEIQQWLPEGHEDLVKVPEKWCIKWKSVEIKEACQKYFNEDWYYYNNSWSISDKSHYWSFSEPKSPIEMGYTEISFEFFVKHILKQNNMKKLIGYKIIKEFPTSDKRFVKGFIAYTTKFGENGWGDLHEQCEKYPEFWQPVYAEESKTLKLGDKGVEVKISKGKIEANGGTIPIKYLEKLQDIMYNPKDKDGSLNWRETHTEVSTNIEFPTVKLGCTTFTKEEVKQVIDTYNELNS